MPLVELLNINPTGKGRSSVRARVRSSHCILAQKSVNGLRTLKGVMSFTPVSLFRHSLWLRILYTLQMTLS